MDPEVDVSIREGTDIPIDEWDYVGLPVCRELVAPVAGAVSFERVRLTPQGRTLVPCILRIGGTELPVPSGARLWVGPGARVAPGERLADWSVGRQEIFALDDGIVQLHLASPPEQWTVIGDVIVGFRNTPARVDLRVGDEIRQSHQLPAGSIVRPDGTRVEPGHVLASAEVPRGVYPRDPLPTWQELRERWCALWREDPGPDEAALGLIKLAADVPIEGILQGLPQDLSERVRACIAAGLPRRQIFIQGTPLFPFEFVFAAAQVAETRFALGLRRFRDHFARRDG